MIESPPKMSFWVTRATFSRQTKWLRACGALTRLCGTSQAEVCGPMNTQYLPRVTSSHLPSGISGPGSWHLLAFIINLMVSLEVQWATLRHSGARGDRVGIPDCHTGTPQQHQAVSLGPGTQTGVLPSVERN